MFQLIAINVKNIMYFRGVIVFVCLNQILCNVEVKTSSGVVSGQTVRVLNQNINQFLSIPFAEPPVGSLRFAKPKPLQKPIDVKMQGNSRTFFIKFFISRVLLMEQKLKTHAFNESLPTALLVRTVLY